MASSVGRRPVKDRRVTTSATLSARDVTVSLGSKTVLDGIDLTLAPGHRVGVVGPNGVGKTTLLQVLAGLLLPDRGSVRRAPPGANVGYLPQEPDRRPAETAEQFLARRTGVAEAASALDRAAAALASEAPGSEDTYAGALDRWLALGGADLDTRIIVVCRDLGLPTSLLVQPTSTLSGGQAARLELSAILLSRFDVYLLDEPTNDLDLEGLERLERFVGDLEAGVVLVSHDRAFLERIVTSVLELDEHTRRATRYEGGWLAYLEEQAVARRRAEEAYTAYADRRRELSERARRQRAWTRAGIARAVKHPRDGDKHIKRKAVASAEGRSGDARRTERMLARLERVDKPWEGWDLRLELATAPRSGDVVASLAGAVVERGPFRLGPVDLEIAWADRIAIVGPNGGGKTTLLDALLGRVTLAAGTRMLGASVVVGELDQARRRLPPERPLLEGFLGATGFEVAPARSLLAKFDLGVDDIDRVVAELSPGERTRALLALFAAVGVNCLVLDEPTNHLDLPAIEQLEMVLETFEGTMLLVTHDRHLLEAVEVDRVLDVRDGQVTERW
jgi:ATPase subunit of ABC transporter with duplicated ATPase domains